MLLSSGLLFLLTVSLLTTPPQVSQFLSARVDVRLVAVGSTFRLSGLLVFNAQQDKMFLNLYGDNPQHYWYKTNLTVVVTPNSMMTLSLWKLQDGVCDMTNVNPDQVPPLKLPENATYIRNQTVLGQECEVWRVASPYPQVEYVDVSVSRGDRNIYLLESQAWTLTKGDVKFGVSTTISLSGQNNSEPGNFWFGVPDGCRIR